MHDQVDVALTDSEFCRQRRLRFTRPCTRVYLFRLHCCQLCRTVPLTKSTRSVNKLVGHVSLACVPSKVRRSEAAIAATTTAMSYLMPNRFFSIEFNANKNVRQDSFSTTFRQSNRPRIIEPRTKQAFVTHSVFSGFGKQPTPHLRCRQISSIAVSKPACVARTTPTASVDRAITPFDRTHAHRESMT